MSFCHALYTFTIAAREQLTKLVILELFPLLGPKANDHGFLTVPSQLYSEIDYFKLMSRVDVGHMIMTGLSKF